MLYKKNKKTTKIKKLNHYYQLIEAEEFANHLGLERIKNTGDNIQCSCPFKDNHINGDKNRSFALLNDGSGRWNCFVCGGGELAKLVMKMHGYSFDEAHTYLKDYANVKGDLSIDRTSVRKTFDFTEHQLKAVQGTVAKYVLNRGVSKETAKRFGLGYNKKTKNVYFPIRNMDSKLIGLIQRGTKEKYYHFAEGFDKANWLYGLEHTRHGEMVYVVEGIFDCLRLTNLGYNAVAIMGAKLSQKQSDLILAYFTSLCYIKDRDKAGEQARITAYLRLYKHIPFYTTSVYKDLPDRPRKDVGDLTDKEIHKLVKTKKTYLI